MAQHAFALRIYPGTALLVVIRIVPPIWSGIYQIRLVCVLRTTTSTEYSASLAVEEWFSTQSIACVSVATDRPGMGPSAFHLALLPSSIAIASVYAQVVRSFQTIPVLVLQLVPLGKVGMALDARSFLVPSDSFGIRQPAFNMSKPAPLTLIGTDWFV